MSTTDKYLKPWRVEDSPLWTNGAYARIVDARGHCFATVPADLAPAFCAVGELIEACETFAEWLRREDAGWKGQRDTPDGEAAWYSWYNEKLQLCQLAQDRVRAALAKARGEG